MAPWLRWSAFTTATGLGLHAFAGGCTFVLSFPILEGGQNAGGNGGEGGAGGSEPPPICDAFASTPGFNKVAIKASPDNPDFTRIRTSGLARGEATNTLYVYGSTSGGLAGHFPTAFDYSVALFLLAVPDVGDPALRFSAQPCAELIEGVSGRMTLFGDELRQVVGGSLGFDFESPGTWSLTDSGASNCGSTPLTILGSGNYYYVGHPFFALVAPGSVGPSFAGASAPGAAPDAPSDGIGLDVDGSSPYLGSIGVASDSVFDGPDAGIYNKFFIQRSTESSADETFLLDDHYQPIYTERRTEAAVATDDDGTVWFGGGSCDQYFCDVQGAFVGKLATSGPPSFLAEFPTTSSGVSAMSLSDHVLLLGGRYTGVLSMLGATLPEATTDDAFVMALDTATEDVLWTYPSADVEPSFSRAGFNTVIDLVALGERDCGAVYVLGCSAPGDVGNPDCVVASPGKTGFVVKLDISTGREVWVQEVELENPGFDFFLPSAITASEDRVWLAATLLGSVQLAGGTVSGDMPQESVVVELSR